MSLRLGARLGFFGRELLRSAPWKLTVFMSVILLPWM